MGVHATGVQRVQPGRHGGKGGEEAEEGSRSAGMIPGRNDDKGS